MSQPTIRPHTVKRRCAIALCGAALFAAQALNPVAAFAHEDGDHGADHHAATCTGYTHLIAGGTSFLTYSVNGKDGKQSSATHKMTVHWHSHVDNAHVAHLLLEEPLPAGSAGEEFSEVTVDINGRQATVTGKKKAQDAGSAGFTAAKTLATMAVPAATPEPTFTVGEKSQFTLERIAGPGIDDSAEGPNITAIAIDVTTSEHCHDHADGDDHDHDNGDDHDHDHDEAHGHGGAATQTPVTQQQTGAEGSSSQSGTPIMAVVALLAVLGAAGAAFSGLIPGVVLPAIAL